MDSFIKEIQAELRRVKTELKQRNYSYAQLLDFASHYVVLFNSTDQASKKIKELNVEIDKRRAEIDKEIDDCHNEEMSAMSQLKDLQAKLSFMDGMKDGFFLGKKIQIKSQAKKGALGKNAKYQPLKDLAKILVNASNFASRRSAAMTIKPEIIAESKRLGVGLSEVQAEITITGWLKEMGLPANI